MQILYSFEQTTLRDPAFTMIGLAASSALFIIAYFVIKKSLKENMWQLLMGALILFLMASLSTPIYTPIYNQFNKVRCVHEIIHDSVPAGYEVIDTRGYITEIHKYVHNEDYNEDSCRLEELK